MKATLFHPCTLRMLTPAVLILAAGGAAWADDPKPAERQPGSWANTLLVLPGAEGDFGVIGAVGANSLTPNDAAAMSDADRCPSILTTAPIVRIRLQVIYNGKNWSPSSIYGTTPDFLFIRNWTSLVDGLPFADQDVAGQKEVCVLGQTVVKQLFDKTGPGDDITDYESPVGKQVRINNKPFKVVGVLSAKGATALGQDQDDIILIPWTTVKYKLSGQAAQVAPGGSAVSTTAPPTNSAANRYPGADYSNLYPTQATTAAADTPQRVGFVNVDQILVQVRSADEIDAATKEITDLLRERHHLRAGQPDDFHIRGPLPRAADPKPADGKPAYRTEPVVRRNLTATVTATGTVEPEEVIDVGAQVSGQILKFGPADPTKPDGPVVDYCSPVKKGQVLAVIDPRIYQAHVDQDKAALATAQAVVKTAEANLEKSKASRDALLDIYKRDEASPGAVPQGQIVADRAAYENAVADCHVQEATVEQAKAGVKQADANLKEAELNLDYCTITSPVDGVIIDRRVNVGQTVVADLSAPSLFLIAKDLSKMQIWIAVNEADIGHIHPGQDVTFTVDARPHKVYAGKMIQIRLNASTNQNVVTYTVVAEADNPPLADPEKGKGASAVDRELLPSLTAHVTILVAEKKNALLVPNAALRWRPQLEQVAPEFRDEYEQSLRKKAPKESKPGAQVGTHGVVWVQDKVFVRPIKLVTGLTDGAMTEVLDDDALDAGTAVIVGETPAGDDLKPIPFVPKKIKDDK